MSILACDAGGTRIKLGIVDNGCLLADAVLPAESDRGLAYALPRIKDTLLTLCKQVNIDLPACRGIGMGFPALVDSRNGRVLNEYGKYRDAPDIDLKAWASAELGLPLAAENDARIALLGEWMYGSGSGSSNLAIITLGTGIGTAVISEGRLLRGPHFQAGNLCGHFIVNSGGALCFCGAHGCVEAETGSARLEDRLRSMPGFTQSVLAEKDRFDYADVFRSAAQGDAVSAAAVERAIRFWAVLCVNIIHAFDLDRIVFGGGLMADADVILPPIRDFVEKEKNTPQRTVEIRAAEYPDHMALLGCEPLVDELLKED